MKGSFLKSADDLRRVDPEFLFFKFLYVGVSKNRGTPKWMVYNENPY